jgi:hypothetical protein
LIEQPTRSARLLDAIGGSKSQIPIDLATDIVRIEMDGVQSGASPLASVVLPGPGNPMMRILRAIRRTSLLK